MDLASRPHLVGKNLILMLMKNIFTIMLCGMSFLTLAQDHEQEVKSQISHVSVFLEGAQITRHGQVSVRPGTTILSFSGVAPGIQEQSIQIEAPAPVKILSVAFRINYFKEHKRPEIIVSLQNERKRLLDLVEQEQSMQEVYNEEIAMLKANRSMGGEANGVEIVELKAAVDYFRSRFSDVKQQLLQTNRNIKKYNDEISKIDAQLIELRSAKGQPMGEITVKISSKTSSTANLKLKYLVNDARWFPSYDVRAVNIKSPVNITYKANVSQNTGEDWDNVELTVSSANPIESGARPIIRPWYLGFNNAAGDRNRNIYGARSMGAIHGRVTDSNGKGLPGVNVIIKGTSVGTVTDASGIYTMMLTGDARTVVFSFVGYGSQEVAINNKEVMDIMLAEDVTALHEVVVSGYGVEGNSNSSGSPGSSYTSRVRKVIAATPVIRQTNIEFTMDEPFSIKSDGEVRATDMIEYNLDASYEYYCVPKIESDAFLIAKVFDWDEYNFLEGEASLFFEGKYIGKSIIDTRNTTDTLTLSLGRDANVLVTREKVKDVSSKQFMGSNQKAVYAYDIVIRNKKGQPITIVIEDQVPVPNTKEITVDKLEDSNGDYQEETGILKWKKEIASGKSETLKLKYAVRYPRQSQMILE